MNMGEFVGDLVFNFGFIVLTCVIDSEKKVSIIGLLPVFGFFFLFLVFTFDFEFWFLTPFISSSYTLYGFPFEGNDILFFRLSFLFLCFFLFFMACRLNGFPLRMNGTFGLMTLSLVCCSFFLSCSISFIE